MVNWAEVGYLYAFVELVEVPAIAAMVAGDRWVKSVNERLERIEARSHQRRANGPPHP
jgi:hypothetical protein